MRNTLQRLAVLRRLALLFEPFSAGPHTVSLEQGRIRMVPDGASAGSGASPPFSMVVVDEAHHVYKDRGQRGGVEAHVPSGCRRLLLSDISQMFPLPEQMIKKFIKEISVEVDKQGWCTYNDREGQKQLTDVPVSNLITPEKACRYESAQFGAAMLKIRGIKNITNGDKISYASNKYCSE